MVAMASGNPVSPSTLAIRKSSTPRFSRSVSTESQHRVHSSALVAPVILDLVVDGVEPDKGVQTVQGALLPLLDLGYDFVGNSAQCGRGDLDAVQLLDLCGDIPVAHSQAVHGQDLGLDFVADRCLVLLDQLRLEGAGAVAGSV